MDAVAVFENVVEVASGRVRTFEGTELEVEGGAYLSPEAVLRTTNEVQRLRDRAREVDAIPKVLPAMLIGAGLAGLALGYWLGRRADET